MREGTKQAFARDEIGKWLDAGRHKPGERMPPIRVMAEALGLKDQPVRRAVAALAAEGRLRTVNGVGVFVCDSARASGKVMFLLRTPGALEPVPDQLGGFISAQIHCGASDGVIARGWEPVHCFMSDFGGDIAKLVRRFEAASWMGIISLGFLGADTLHQLAARIGAHRLVTTRYGAEPTSLNEVRVRVKPGVYAALDKALELGHRKFAFFYGENVSSQWSHMERYRVFMEWCRERGVAMDPACLVPTGGTTMDGYRATLQLLERLKNVTLIFGATDDRCRGVLQALADRGLTPGKHVSVLGYDDMPEAEALNLATVRVPRTQIGASAVALLERTTQEKLTGEQAWLDTEPVFRGSLGPAL